MRARTRLAVALALAALLHGILLLVPIRERRTPAVCPIRPVRLVALEPLPPLAELPPPPRAHPASRPPDPVAYDNAIVPAEPAPPAPHEIDLFPSAAIDEVATPMPADELTDEELFVARMARWTDDFHSRERVLSGETPPELVALRERLWSWYLPGSQQLARHAVLGLGDASAIVPQLEYYTSGRANKPSDAMANLFGDRRHIDPTGRIDLRGDFVLACLGFCNDAGHEVARLETTVVIDHDEMGVPEDWSVAKTSGNRDFDAEALSAVAAASELTPAEELRGAERPARRTDWVFRVIAYRWSQAELRDPLFVPPGRVLEAYTSGSGKTTMVREVELVALRFD